MNHTQARLWDFPSAALLIFILVTASQRLYITHWAPGLETAIILTLIGVVLGSALGFSKFKPRAVFWLTIGYSIPVVFLVLGGIFYRGISWLERLTNLSDRLAFALGLFITKYPVEDTILFVVFMALVFWIIGLISGYAMMRSGNFVGAVVPAGVVLVIIQLYDSGKASSDAYLAVYLFLCLLFLGRLTYVRRRFFWKERRLSMLAESRVDLNITLAVVALATMLLVWLAPTSVKSLSNVRTAWENITRPLRDVQKDLGHAVAGLQGGRKVNTVYFFGDKLPLGSTAATGETAYFRIKAPLVNSSSRYYWRVRSYNIFLNDQWYAENVSSTAFSPDQALIPLADPEGVTSNFVFSSLSANLETLVTPARPVWVSHSSEMFFLQVPQGKMDPIQFESNPPVLAGEKYSVRANIYEPTIAQLRNAGETYPDWVTGHYLQLPDDLSPEIITLGKRITADAKTPYDMAAAITTYLRNDITYSMAVVDPPAGRDPLDWFLFNSRSGFCNYYATAEVILLRTVGIPARMVVGFAQGEYDSPDTYVVRQRDLHAWPEGYFPGAGWVEFEPTTSQAPLERPLDENTSATGLEDETQNHAAMSRQSEDDQESLAQTGEKETSSAWRGLANWFLRLALIYCISVSLLWIYSFGMFDNIVKPNLRILQRPVPVLVKNFLEKRALTPPGWLLHWAYLAELNPIERSYKTVYRSLHWLSEKTSPAQTPAEAADILARHLPKVSNEIYSLLQEYQRHLYSQKHGYPVFAHHAMRIIRKEALRAAIQQRWRAFRQIFRFGAQ
jgi:transglutaminase-like putative cysteine protease